MDGKMQYQPNFWEAISSIVRCIAMGLFVWILFNPVAGWKLILNTVVVIVSVFLALFTVVPYWLTHQALHG